MSDMITWLKDQIHNRRTFALVAAKDPGPIWGIDGECVMAARSDGGLWDWVVSDEVAKEALEHIVLNDPRDVIARCDAELAILGMWTDLCDVVSFPDGVADGRDPGEAETDRDLVTQLDEVVRTMAAGYQHRPGFKEEWRA